MKRSIAIIGGGPSALMLAANLDENKYDITIYERNSALGRKFLVAGDGGFNLTHAEPLKDLVKRYHPSGYLDKCLLAFSNTHLREWLLAIGIETYTGTSNRVFPLKGIKPIMVLNAILKILTDKKVKLKTKFHWTGWSENNALKFISHGETILIQPDITVFALGGASWTVTGSDGEWTSLFKKKQISIVPFEASNCAFGINWPDTFIKKFEGKPLKNISVLCGDAVKKGELVITKYGVEGGAIYALSGQLRTQLDQQGQASIFIDLKPDYSSSQITEKLDKKGKGTITDLLKADLKMNEIQIGMLKNLLTKEEFMNVEILAEKIKKLPVIITGIAPIDEAISTVGGIALSETDEHFQLKKMPDHYVIGEMLDWDAPTGGYLLQASFSMGHYLAKHLNS